MRFGQRWLESEVVALIEEILDPEMVVFGLLRDAFFSVGQRILPE